MVKIPEYVDLHREGLPALLTFRLFNCEVRLGVTLQTTSADHTEGSFAKLLADNDVLNANTERTRKGGRVLV